MSKAQEESSWEKGRRQERGKERVEDEKPSLPSDKILTVTLLSSEWRSSKGGLSTIGRELAIQLAKHLNVEVYVYLPKCSEEDKKVAGSHSVQLIEAEELPGFEPIDWLTSLPKCHLPHCLIGHGLHLGRQIPAIQRHYDCKWVQVVHTAPEELGMYKSYEEAIFKGEQKHQAEVKLCELADQVVAVGPKLADAYSRYLRFSGKDQDVINLTPSIFTEFLNVQQATEERRAFYVLVFGRGDGEDFKLKGYDIAVQAVTELKDSSYQLMFVGAPTGKEDEVAEKLLQHGIPGSQLTVRRFMEGREELAKLFCEVDLAIMPSRTEGFGLTALEALSAGLPVLVSGNSGLGDALKKVPSGFSHVVDSEDPKEWAKAIKLVRQKGREVRLKEANLLREQYTLKYSWEKQCDCLVEKMLHLSFGNIQDKRIREQNQVENEKLDNLEKPKKTSQEAAVKLKVDVEHMEPTEHSIQDRTPVSTEESGGSQSVQQHGAYVVPVSSGQNPSSYVNAEAPQAPMYIPTPEQVLCSIAANVMNTTPPKNWDEHDHFLTYLERIRATLTSVSTGSLLITVQCDSLQILERLWEDYLSGHLGEVIQRSFVTEEILTELSLAELTLKTTISEEEYKACKAHFEKDPSEGSSSSIRGPTTPGSSGAQNGQHHTGVQGSPSPRIKHVGPEPTRYVDFLACQGYVVEILGGKHFKTPEGEFVEMKSGTQFKIHVKNTHVYGCNLDISIDGYDVGGWVVDGGQEFTIERPAYEAKKFTFYRVKTAPEEAGIEPSRAENGIVKCVFTPEAFLNIPVTIPESPQPLNIYMPPSASVGDLKREIQHKLNVAEDLDQVLCAADDKVLLNSDSVRGLSTRNLRLIDTELEIIIETSTETNFSLKVHPGRAKVCDVMEQIERKLKVPLRDQKLYHGRARLSDAPRRGLPYGLICSPQPTLILIMTEYIHITVANEDGVLQTIKIDKEKSLKALMEEITSCSSLQENEEAILFFNGRQMCPTKDKGTLTSLGLVSGSKLELKVNIIFITVKVRFPNRSPTVSVRCSPHETFKDLVKKLETRGKRTEKVTFAMQDRVFDPDQDKAPLQEYRITHGSVLEIRKDRGKSSAASGSSGDADVSMWNDDVVTSFSEDDEAERGTQIRRRPGEKESFLRLSKHKEMTGPTSSTGYVGRPIAWKRAFSHELDPAWRAGGTTLQGYSTQQFVTAEAINVDPSRKVELVLRLVAREDEEDEENSIFPKDECKSLSTLYPPAVPE